MELARGKEAGWGRGILMKNNSKLRSDWVADRRDASVEGGRRNKGSS